MRHRSQSTLSNPIDATSVQNLVDYVLKNGGFLRVEFTRSTGEKRIVLLRPVRLVRGDVRDAVDRFKAYTEQIEAAGLATTHLVAPFFRTVIGTDTYTNQLW